MKQTFDLLAEVLSLPFSDFFLKHDYFADCIPYDDGKMNGNQMEWMVELSKNIRRMSENTAGYIDRHTILFNIDDLQSIIHYVFDVEDVVKSLSEVNSGSSKSLRTKLSRANYFYIMLLKRTAKSFLSIRSGKAVVKYWDGSSEAYPGTDNLPSGLGKTSWNRNILGKQPGPHRVEAWHSLGQCIPESLLISAYAACLAEEQPNISLSEQKDACYRTLLQFGGTVHIADLLLDKTLNNGMAETHLHAGASRTYDLIWETSLEDALTNIPPLKQDYYHLFRDPIKADDYHRFALNALILRAVLASYLVSGYSGLTEYIKQDDKFNGLLRRQSFLSELNKLAKGESICCDFPSSVRWLMPLIERLSGGRSDYLAGILRLREEVSQADIGIAERCFIAWSILYITQAPTDSTYAAAFIYYLRLKNYSYRIRTQDNKNKGLTYFRKYFLSSTDMGRRGKDERIFHIIYTALRDERVIKTELRFSPPVSNRETLADAKRDIALKMQDDIVCFISQHIRAVIALTNGHVEELTFYSRKWDMALRKIDAGKTGVLISLVRDDYHVDLKQVHPHRLGIIYHLVKHGENSEEPSCFLRERRVSERDRHAAFSFGTARFQYEAAVQAIIHLRRLCPAIGRLIVGIDAASAELPTDPWVFAPAFRMAREPEPIPEGTEFLQPFDEHQMLGFTYHVGEEFRHPLSGLRHIGESIEFFKLHTGDRLGHVLAMGINLKQWANKHKMIAIPCQEWMEDCLWAWNVAGMFPENGISPSHITFLETQIYSCARQIYGTLDGITIKKLYDAYLSKTLCHKDLCALAERWCRQNKTFPSQSMNCSENGFYFSCAQSVASGQMVCWNEDSLAMSHHCARFKSRMEREIMREITTQEIELSGIIQHHLRRIVAEKGIVLEENPSSNTLIGEMDGILAHPICELRSNEKEYPLVMTTINTDDPSVFNSNVANEHALIYFALLHHGYTVEDALKSVDEIRKSGLLSSFLSDNTSFELLLDEYEQLIRSMRHN